MADRFTHWSEIKRLSPNVRGGEGELAAPEETDHHNGEDDGYSDRQSDIDGEDFCALDPLRVVLAQGAVDARLITGEGFREGLQ